MPEIIEHDGRKFERTGLFRIPEPGDYWWSDIDKGVYKCCGRIKNRSASRKREILREIPAEPSTSQPWANRAFEILMALHLSVIDELEPKIKAEIESVVNAFKIPDKPPAQPAQLMKFSDGDIRRDGLPHDVFELLHDLCYDHIGRDRESYQLRAQQILSRKSLARWTPKEGA